MIDRTHNPSLQSWVPSANESDTDFPSQNLPFATWRAESGDSRLGVAIGDQILDLTAAFGIESMRTVMSMPAGSRSELRHRISNFLSEYTIGAEGFLRPMAATELLLPCSVLDYTDFYASLHH